jgi:hypothetical protein
MRLGDVRDLPPLEQRVEDVLRHPRSARAILFPERRLGDLHV